MVETARRAADAENPRTILIVEDDDLLRMVLRMELEKNGLNVFEAGNGQAGLAVLRDMAPDIIVTDLMMPVMDGFSFIAAVRRTNGGAALPIIVISAMKSADMREKAVEAGANLFCEKPLSPESLLAVIKNHLPAIPS